MTDIERYVDAAERENTRRSYASATRHFEVEWGGHLPASPDAIARYLAAFAGQLASSTLKQRLSALASWHREHGFVDPTRSPIVRKVIKGIQALHPHIEKQAEPLQLAQLAQASAWLDKAIDAAHPVDDRAAWLRHSRDRALLLLGFWRGFRGDELTRIRIESISILPGQGMTCFVPRTKADRTNTGTIFKVPALSRLCPVTAVSTWISNSALTEGPLFRRISRWGGIDATSIAANAIPPVLRRIFRDAGLASPDEYSGHSLRRGFATWASASGWSVKSLMEYVGWRDIHSAARYIESMDPFGRQRIEASLQGAHFTGIGE